MDLADLVRVATRLLDAVPAVAAAVRGAHSHVLVDEFQDCSGAQLEFLRALAPPPSACVTVVGDDDQSIYGFQGADGARAFGAFRRWYGGGDGGGRHGVCGGGARVVCLAQNFRSCARIVRAASALIVHSGVDSARRAAGLNAPAAGRDGTRAAGCCPCLLYTSPSPRD